MHYELTGKGESAIVLIHGFGGSGRLWKWQVEYFEDRARVLTVDLPGHGQTHWVSAGLEEMAKELCAVMDQAGVPVAHVAASSFGGLVALKLWQRDPARARSLSFVGSLPRFTATEDFPAGLTVAGIRKLSDQFQGDVGAVLDMFVRSFSTSEERLSAQYARVKDLRRSMPVPEREALQAFLHILETADLRDILSRVSVPLQFINGDGDYIAPPAVVDVLRRQLPQARFDDVKGAGHGLFLTMPDKFNQVYSEFIGL